MQSGDFSANLAAVKRRLETFFFGGGRVGGGGTAGVFFMGLSGRCF